MPTILSVGSGKGGVGKSVSVSNLGLALAARGFRTTVADLDVGGSNLATLFGAFEEGPDLSDFLSRRIDRLTDIERPLRENLSLIAGAGDSLATANPNWASKQRLMRHLRALPSDVVIIDIGAGTGNHALDFFNLGDRKILVTLPEPTASVDAYRFLKLAATRALATRVPTRNPERRAIERSNFERVGQVWEKVRLVNPAIVRPTSGPGPWVVLNQSTRGRRYFKRLQGVAKRFLEQELELLGEVPRDESVVAAVADFLPVVEREPTSTAARAWSEIAAGIAASLRTDTPRGFQHPPGGSIRFTS